MASTVPASASTYGPPYSPGYNGPSAFADCSVGGPACHSAASIRPDTGAFSDDMGCSTWDGFNCDPATDVFLLQHTALTAGTEAGHAVSVHFAIDSASFRHAAGSTESGAIEVDVFLGFVNEYGYVQGAGGTGNNHQQTLIDVGGQTGPRDFTLTISGVNDPYVAPTQPLDVVIELRGTLQRTEPTLASVPLPTCVRVVTGGCLWGVSVPKPNVTADDLTATGRVLSIDVS